MARLGAERAQVHALHARRSSRRQQRTLFPDRHRRDRGGRSAGKALRRGSRCRRGRRASPRSNTTTRTSSIAGSTTCSRRASHALAKKGDAASYAEADELARAALRRCAGLTAERAAGSDGAARGAGVLVGGRRCASGGRAARDGAKKAEEVRANGGEHAPAATCLENELEPRAADLASLGARFAPPSTAAAAPANAPQTGASSGSAAIVGMPVTSLDGGAPPAVPPASIASPPGDPSTNTIVDPLAAPSRASAPSSVSSGASRGNQQ